MKIGSHWPVAVWRRGSTGHAFLAFLCLLGLASQSETASSTELSKDSAVELQRTCGAGRWVAGTNYAVLPSPKDQGKRTPHVAVAEVFMYTCPACFGFENRLTKWAASREKDVQLVRVPTAWDSERRSYAELYYTLDALGRIDLHQAIYDTIHLEKKLLYAGDEGEARTLQEDFAQKHGVLLDAFKSTRQSQGVKRHVEDAVRVGKRYKVERTPTFIVGWKYTTDVARAGGDENLVTLLDCLVDAEKQSADAKH